MSKGQSKKMSLAESLVNVAIGYVIAIAAQVTIFPLFGINVPLHDNLLIGALFTVVSIVRSFALRRGFNYLHHRQREKTIYGPVTYFYHASPICEDHDPHVSCKKCDHVYPC